MTKSRRVFAVIAVSSAIAALWIAYGPREIAQQADAQQPAAGQQDMQANLDQAAASIVAAAEQGVHEARSEEQMLERMDLTVEALRILGLLGASEADARAAKLLDDVQSNASPAAAEVIIQMRLARQLQRWARLSQAEREKAINRFVSDVQNEGLTPGHAGLLMRLVDNLEINDQRDLAALAVNGLLPDFQNSTEPSVQRRAPVMEGVVRRLDLVGKPIELEGTLLDGSEFDWSAYRGKVVLVDFFANWCSVCREEVPNIMQCYRAYRDKGFEVVGISLDKQPGLAEMYRKQTGFQFPTLFSRADPQAMEWKSPMAMKYGVTSLPRAILIDQNGNVVDIVARGPRLVQNLRELLGPPAAGLGSLGDLIEEPNGESDGQSAVVPAAFEEQSESQSDTEQKPAPTVPEN